MVGSERPAAGAVHGFPAVLTSFVGRAREVTDIASRLEQDRLVTLTGPGGAGKTRLAGEVARRVAGRFADGVWLAELAAVRDPGQVVTAVAAALGIRDLPAVAGADALAALLARRQLLLVLDNCEQVVGAAAELCGRLLLGADDVRVVATSREALRIAGELRYPLGPLTLPPELTLPGEPAAPAGEQSEAETLFADRAGRVDPGFTMDEDTRPAVAKLVARLDGMPLAIELAAARVASLGVTQLLERIDDRFELLTEGDRLAQQRQRSLAATVHWSYQLLGEAEQRVFRSVSAFPGPFTLEGAEAVAGAGAGEPVPDLRAAVLHLVDCSLLSPPHAGPDGQSRYAMLETLRIYAAARLAETGDEAAVMAALAGYAAGVAADAAAALHSGTAEAASLRRLDCEDATVSRALAWSADHDPATQLRLALTLEPWWQIRGRLTSQTPVLAAAAGYAEHGSAAWSVVTVSLGAACMQSGDSAAAVAHLTAVRDALCGDGPPSSSTPALLTLCLGGRSAALLATGKVADATEDARRALAVARESGQPELEATALGCLSFATWHGGDRNGALRLARQAYQLPGGYPAGLRRALTLIVAMVLTELGDLPEAEQACAQGIARCREAGDLGILARLLWTRAALDLRANRVEAAAAHLREQLELASRAGLLAVLRAGVGCCGDLCAATGRPADALTLWAVLDGRGEQGLAGITRLGAGRRDEALRSARALLGETATRAAEQRGAAMSLETAAEYALVLAAAPPLPAAPHCAPAIPAGVARLSPRERDLLTLVAQGRTDAQIAAQLYITVRTVSSHLDRIRDKTGCRRRADLTRLALSAGLV